MVSRAADKLIGKTFVDTRDGSVWTAIEVNPYPTSKDDGAYAQVVLESAANRLLLATADSYMGENPYPYIELVVEP